jgi:hypothetical protein
LLAGAVLDGIKGVLSRYMCCKRSWLYQ